MSLQSLKAAKAKSILTSSVPLVCIGFGLGYAWKRLNSQEISSHQKLGSGTGKDGSNNIQSICLEIDNLVHSALAAVTDEVKLESEDKLATVVTKSNWQDYLFRILAIDEVQALLIRIAELDVFSDEFGYAVSYNVSMLGFLKQLKYWYSLSCSQFLILLCNLSSSVGHSQPIDESNIIQQYGTSSNSSSGSIGDISKSIIGNGKNKTGSDDNDDGCDCHNCGDSGIATMILGKLRDLCLSEGSPNLQSMKMKDVIITKHSSDSDSDSDGNVKSLISYVDHLKRLESIDCHSIYPTSIYRQSKGLCLSNKDLSLIECVMSTTIRTSIMIENDVLNTNNKILRNIYKPFSRVVIIIDEKVDKLYKNKLDNYFIHNGINIIKLCYTGNECDKHIKSVENILTFFKENNVQRNELVLIIGGGVITDLGGFACSLYHRNTPYIMLCTSIVSGIDAGPSPRTCCDGFGYKNIFGCYHPPVLTITDPLFFNTLKHGWIRHGIAEIIKMAVVKDISLFNLLEKATNKLIYTKFGTEKDNDNDSELGSICDEIIKKAMKCYVESEYGNLWETHQCRPHAYGHTWSPGFELPSGMLHGHAVACGMGFGAFLSYKYQYINISQLVRILRLINNCELSLWHDAMNNVELIWKAQERMVEKRGGNLCAPVPKGKIGQCGYINKLTRDGLKLYLNEYKEFVMNGKNSENMVDIKFLRNGYGIDAHCSDVGLEDPSKVDTMANKYESEIKQLQIENAELKHQLTLCQHKQ